MAVQISDTSKKVYQKEWKDKHAYDKSLNSQQARALQRWAYNNGNFNGADQNANIDGKWGEYSARRAQKVGMNIAKDYSSFTTINGTYVWDPKVGDYVKQNEIVITPQNKASLPKEGNYHPGQITPGWMGAIGVDIHGLSDWERAKREGNGVKIDLNNLTPVQAKDLYNFLKANPNLNEQDWIRSQENLHQRNMNQIEMASVLGTTATSLMTLASGNSAGKGSVRGSTYAPNKLTNGVEKTLDATGRGAQKVENAVQKGQTAVGNVIQKGKTAIGNVAEKIHIPEKLENYVEQAIYPDKITPYSTKPVSPSFWQNFKPKMATYWNNGKEALRNVINPESPLPPPASTRYIDPKRVAMKTGGKFQQGGSIDQQIIQLVQAAQQGNQEAIQQLTQIKQAAEQGDQQALQIMQKIQQIMQQVQSAKLGAALNYIKRIKGECPEGQELVYFKKGGSICKQCVAKQNAKDDDPVKAFKEKCGGKTKKAEKGGPVYSKTRTESKTDGKGASKTKYTRQITDYINDKGKVVSSDTVYSKQQIGLVGDPVRTGPSSSSKGLSRKVYEKNRNLYDSIGSKKKK